MNSNDNNHCNLVLIVIVIVDVILNVIIVDVESPLSWNKEQIRKKSIKLKMITLLLDS